MAAFFISSTTFFCIQVINKAAASVGTSSSLQRPFYGHGTTVVRWYIFKPEIPIYLSIYWKVPQWNMLVFYGHVVYFTAKRYISWQFGIFYPVLAGCTEKNLATSLGTSST
jgi:hypothetical protein